MCLYDVRQSSVPTSSGSDSPFFCGSAMLRNSQIDATIITMQQNDGSVNAGVAQNGRNTVQ